MNSRALGPKTSSGNMVNQWVIPSFQVPDCGEQWGGKLVSSQKPRKRRVQRPDRGFLPESIQRDPGEAWVDRYSPRSQAELAIHKKKVEEVERWLLAHSSKGGVLLLTGPSGCGKTATVRVLCQELELRIQEWTNPSIPEPNWREQDSRTNGFSNMSQSAQFHEFLFRANRYNSLRMASDGGGAADRTLLLVEDLPNQFYRQPCVLHEALRCLMKTVRRPLLFIVSDSSSRLLFPKEIQEELGISSISFNPVAPTTMKKVLTCIWTQEAAKEQSGEKQRVMDETELEALCAGSSGDIRSAINSLQFSFSSDTSLGKDLWRMKKRRAVGPAKPRNQKGAASKERGGEQTLGGKDASLFLFRALGKILHCKRGGPEGVPAARLPSHLSHHHREPLQILPELVVERSHMSGELFNLYLHQNYLDFFSKLEDVDRASEYLSDADLLAADWTSRSTLLDYSSSVATRGLLHSHSQQISMGFRPLHKPHWLLVSKKHRENCAAARDMFTSFCLTPVSLQTELLPYLSRVSNTWRNPDQITFIQDIAHMSLRTSNAHRWNLVILADKDPGEVKGDSDDDDDAAEDDEEGLTESQPQPNTNHTLVETDHVTIEEYASD